VGTTSNISSLPYSGGGTSRISSASVPRQRGDSHALQYRSASDSSSANPQNGTERCLHQALRRQAIQRPDLVIPPWGAERANLDQPPREAVVEKRASYHRQLDEQAKRKHASREMQKPQADATSFHTSTHTWGAEPNNPEQERSTFKDQVAMAEKQHRTAHEEREKERRAYARWAAAAEREQALLFESEQVQRKEASMNLAAEWHAVTAEKRHRQEAERRANLLAERAAMERLTAGMSKPRRVRKGIHSDFVPVIPMTVR